MSTSCEFPNCSNTSDGTKVNRLRIHENLAQKWDQVFRENLGDRIGDYLYICRAHFDSNTKKLILPKPTAVAEIEEVTFNIKTETTTKDVPKTRKRKASPSVEGMKVPFRLEEPRITIDLSFSTSRRKSLVQFGQRR